VRIQRLFAEAPRFLEPGNEYVQVKGWVRTVRDQKQFAFLQINDGSNVSGVQVVVDSSLPGFAEVTQLMTGCSVAVSGYVRESPGKEQPIEIHASEVELIGSVSNEYPLQKKRHSFEFLRGIAHLRPRTNSFAAVARIRSALASATHTFFQSLGFVYLHSPIITSSDCEGAGEMFRVTTLPPGASDDRTDFFGQRASLTVSGQLSAEAYACAMGDVYTFGPTFRAENSNTKRHLAEFWMIEPEMAFASRDDAMDNAEEYVKFGVSFLLERQVEDLQLFDRFIEKGIVRKLERVRDLPFVRISYTDAIEILSQSTENFEFMPKWGADLQTEHERYLAEKHFQRPVFVYNYPASIKAFYMRLNDVDPEAADGRQTVAAFDLLVPGIGELIGGSQREERYDVLRARMQELNLNADQYWWYLDLRRYGTVPHAGYGLGFERFVQFCTGMDNIRDVIPFPRYPGHCEF
jgi:asparaginyl-tRNA synthetase